MWITITSFFWIMAIIDPIVSEENRSSVSALDSRTSKFKAGVHHILEGARIRTKRQLDGSDSLIRKLKFGQVIPVNLSYLSELSLTFWLSIESRNQVLIGATDGRIILFEILDEVKNASVVALSEIEPISIKAKAFSYSDEQWFVVLHELANKFYIRLYQRIGRSLEKRQTIPLNGSSDMKLVIMKGTPFLVVATYSTTTNQGYSYRSSVTLYYWAQTQFDAIASRVTYGARSLDCWVFEGSLYIAVGQEIDDERNMKIGSPIYLYNNKEGNELVLWEMLTTFGPSKVRHFSVAENHYIIFIGRQDAVIYWWSSGQFLEWQSLQGTAYASDVSVLSLGYEVAIVIALKEDALFYTLGSSGQYEISFTMSFGQTNLRSLQFMFSGRTYYALALFAESQAQSMWRLGLDSHYLPSIDSLDPLKQCLLDTQERVAGRQKELEAIKTDLDKVWRKGSNQTITSEVIVEGRILGKESIVKDVIILRKTNIPHSSFSFVLSALAELSDSVESGKEELRGVVLKSARQEIRGIKYFQDEVFVPSLRMESLENDISINDVRISRLQNYALRKIGNQVIPYTAIISSIYTERVNVGAINGISTNDLLLLHSKQFVTGNLFFSDISASDISVRTINSIPAEDIVTTKTSQIIKDLKTFSNLKSHAINVKEETNGVDLDSIYQKIATTDNYNEFKGHLTFQNPVTVNGNLFLTSKLNKVVDTSRLVSESVNRDSQQDLTGYYTFKSSPSINGDLLIAESINGVSTDNLLTLGSNQKIYADITFEKSFLISHDLLVIEVNGINLGEQAVQKALPRQFMNGRKIFKSNMVADFVDMSDYVTLDGVDPSLLVQDIIHHEKGVVNHNFTAFKDVTVLGNLKVTNGINGFSIIDLPSSVWLKSIEQIISGPVYATVFHVSSDLEVGTVNDLDLEENIVSSYKDGVIVSPKSFHSQTILKSLKTSGNIMVNGIGLKSLKTELEHYINEWTVQGDKTFDSFEIFGNLGVTNINNFGISDVMYPDAYQIVTGPVEFTTEVTPLIGNVKLDEISFANFNGIDVHDYFRRAATSTLSSVIRNKRFANLKASNMSLPSGSKLSGVSLQEMAQRVVTLNTPQLITGSKSFDPMVSFSKIISVFTMNGLQLSNFLDSVVLTDEVSKISRKQFLGDVKTTQAFVQGKINGIKLEDMASNVLYKTEGGEISKPFTFKGDIDVGDLSASVIDGVKWDDLIFLRKDEVLETGWFLSNIYTNQDIFITGLLNGCDLSQISSNVYANQTTQVINKRMNVHTIIIFGNLNLKHRINNIQLEMLHNYITTADDQTINSNVVIESTLNVNNLVLTDYADSMNIAFIMKDAVRHSISQDITGQKIFRENVDVTVLAGDNLYVSNINGIDIEELQQISVVKNGYQEITGDKTFSSLFINVSAISGLVNSLSLPQDVVRTDTSEYIGHQTYFTSHLFIPAGLTVNGLIDGTDINKLIERRVTLNTDQNITAQLTFHEDVFLTGDLTIDGTVNEIVLELVAKVKATHPLQGYKIFMEFNVAGSLSASSVNGYSIPQLDSNTLRHNKDDYINEIQIFNQIHAQNSLYSEWINGVSMKWLSDSFVSLISNLKPVLNYLEDLSSILQQLVVNQLTMSKEQVSKFAFFAVHQEIDVGPTSRILRGHDFQDNKFSHSLVVWTKQKHCIFMEKCCHLEFSYWGRVQKNGIVMVDSAAESGRFYPIPDPFPVNVDQNFFIWTNSTDEQSKSCDDRNKRMVLASLSNLSLKQSIDLENVPQLSDVKSFRKGNLYAVAAFYFDFKNEEYGSTIVYGYDEMGHWSEHEVLPSFGVLSQDVISYTQDYRDEILLALGTGMNNAYSTVYKWNNINRSFKILQNIPSRYITSTLWIRKGKDLLLSLAGVDVWPNKAVECSELVSGGQIDIYFYRDNLKWIQSIPIGGVVSTVTFSSDGDTYLVAASSQQHAVYIFEWKGYSGFVQIQSISIDAQHVNVYNINDDIYMTVASLSGPSKVLKMVRKGKSLSRMKVYDQKPLEQQDEDPDNSRVVNRC